VFSNIVKESTKKETREKIKKASVCRRLPTEGEQFLEKNREGEKQKNRRKKKSLPARRESGT